MEIVGINMFNNTLANSINTFLNSGRQNVSSLISQMKTDKIDFTSLMTKLGSTARFSDFAAAQISNYATLRKEPVVDLFRDSSIRLKTLFNAANAGGIVLDSMVSILGSEIEKVEKDIENLQIFIDNYEFISGKDDLYNSNYLEKFDNFYNDYKYDGYDLPLVDRDGLDFADNGGGFIDSKNGVFKIGSNQKTINVIKNIESIDIKTNYESYISSTSDFKNLFNDNLFDSWNVTVKSPTILDIGLSDYNNYINYDISSLKGAKTVVEVKFHSVVEMDGIKINPNYGNDFQLLQVVMFNPVVNYSSSANSDVVYKLLMNSSKVLNSSFELTFEKSSVTKLIFIFNKSAYTRAKKSPIISELNSKVLDQFVQERLAERFNRFSKIQDMSYWYFLRNVTIEGFKQNKSKDVEYYSFKFPEELHSYANKIKNELFKASAYSKEDLPIFNSSSIFVDLLHSIATATGLDTSLFINGYFYETSSINRGATRIDLPGFIPGRNSGKINDPKSQFINNNYGYGKSTDIVKKLLIEEPEDSYEYSFSLKSIDFFITESTSKKACFISKKIPTDGQILGIKSKVSYLDSKTISTENKYDLKSLISYELSVSNIDYPSMESDWIPLAFNNQSIIESELVFFDVTDFSTKLRFPPKTDSILLYKDGMIVSPTKYSYLSQDEKLILNDTLIYTPNSFFCVYYQIDSNIYNPYELDFVKRNLYNESIKQYRNNSGLGQIFSKTNTDGSIVLDYTPYVNETYITNATYDQYFGTIFTTGTVAGYSPVKIKLSDGSFAVNLTNYSRQVKGPEFFGSSIQFIQNGRNIVFNQSINSPFTVYYEYIPYSLRFRFILRKNIPNLQVSGAADSVLLKMKTSYFDPFYDKLNYVSKV